MSRQSTIDIPLARRDEIALRLVGGQQVGASELAQEFGVSDDAIRRDLRALAAQGLCRRVYGGALPPSPAGTSMAVRIGEDRERKDALAIRAAALIAPGEFLFLDSGSTNLALASHLPPDHNLTVATNSIDIASVLMPRRDLRLIMVGGVVNTYVGSAVDVDAAMAVSRMNLDRVVLGACSVSINGGISAFDPDDAAFKRTLLGVARQCLVLSTTKKLGTSGPYRVAAIPEVGTMIVEEDAEVAIIDALTRAGTTVLRADPPN
ncbi:MAG: DeoR/GlpR transcriptional regulator [Cereibacter sphaeroides]|uniref:DeoR/GlpR transcriptional regulator n=1 Tax=Cereibacter sphaeroides TaxID=1063 RepID=A0A2W5SL36_CERSP|nr:MAG: DeoR/GlpR transcriptional regulator [Cereibacter sphaeroides]